MKVFLNMTLFHLKRILKDPKILLMVAAPLVMVFFMMMIFESNQNVETGKFGIENHSKYFEKEIYPLLDEAYQIPLDSSAETLQDELLNKHLDIVYVIPKNFEKQPKIIAKSLDGKLENQYLENQIKQVMLKKQKAALLKDYDIQLETINVPDPQVKSETKLLSSSIMISMFMIVYFMYLNSAMFSLDLFKMRKNNVLRRSIVSKSPRNAIFGSVLSAYGIILLMMSLITLVIIAVTLKVELNNILLIMALLIANIVFIMGEVVFLFRIIKEEQVLQSVSMALGMAIVLIPVFTMDTSFEKLAMISPFYWTMEALDYQVFWPNGIIIILMGLILFTAGSLNLEQLSNQKV